MLSTIFASEIDKLEALPGTDRETIAAFRTRLADDPRIVRDENRESHFCAFFIPIHKPTRSVFLGHHKKAGSWIPPGGHIDSGELPIDTVKREFGEELAHNLTTEPIYLVNLSLITIENPASPCKYHYDFWYTVETDKLPFAFDQKEFYDAGWFSADKTIKMVTHPVYHPLICGLVHRL